MKIIRDLQKDKTFDTDLYTILKNLPDDKIFHQEHNLRHPLAIYNISSKRVFNAFDKVYEMLEKSKKFIKDYNMQLFALRRQKSIISDKDIILKNRLANDIKQISKDKNNMINNLLNSNKELLDSLMAFIDDGYHIMKTLYPKNTIKSKEKFANKWVKKADKKIFNDYIKKIKDYRYNILGPIVNKIKHNHARLRNINYSTSDGYILGYYIEGIDSGESIGPDPEIHKKYKGMHTAFSFNRRLKLHLVYFYIIAHHQKVTVSRIFKKRNNKKLKANKYSKDNNDDILKICNNISSLPNSFFIDEHIKKTPEINFDSKNKKLILKYPGSKPKLNYPEGFKIEFFTSGDGISKTFKLPYFNKKEKNNT